jgi:molybdopterin synthase catalytic subunit
MQLDVLLFASLKDEMGQPSISVDVPDPVTVSLLLKELEERHPRLRGRLRHVRVAVDQEFRGGDDPIPGDAEVALIPPVSGG